jgi:cytidylate kinase
MSLELIIAIDGPAASGKSTTAKCVAKELELLYIDTGAMYRAATYHILQENISLDNPEAIASTIAKISINQLNRNNETITFLNGVDVSSEIRSREVTNNIHTIASNREVREIMVSLQQYMGKSGNVILDGRDIGTVVFPKAPFKFFMVATAEERAKRRLLEFLEKGIHLSLDQMISEIKARDLQDEMRSVGPLKKADDAMLIDTSKLNIDEQVKLILKKVKKENLYCF